MKKAILCVLACVLGANTFAQNSTALFALTDKTSDDNLEYEKYFYTSDLLLDKKEILYSDGMQAKDVLHYNADKLVSKLDGYQVLNGDWKKVYYIDYSYDPNGHKLSRINYNNFGGTDFTLGGIYQYQYENNRRTSWTLQMMGKLVEQGTLHYSNDGKIQEEIGQDSWSTGSMENSWKVTYTYNSNGSLQKTTQYFWTGADWNVFSLDQFFYDTIGNCTKWEHLTDGMVTNRFEYEYDTSYTRDQLLLPSSPEDETEPVRWVETKNKMTRSHWHTQNDVGTLIYVCDFIYNYTPLANMAVAETDVIDDGLFIYPNPASDKITIQSENQPIKNLVILDLSGRMVQRNSNINKNNAIVDVSNLKAGTYILQTTTSKKIKSKKIIVK